ncbi:DUF502 domain-containing protein [Candidatus Berkiella aquae]|uniref:DUF502 domain-containing protein n=1 Tax=Candidatus Berkiella aquae TaxID=295108 RepID=A0A0Q9YN58_9GAMM|nr:DUF502 domain-containing protein [Candidatus Berkiella aquae]MCS5712575.1 DUF502 domain-containing protein [Candidatus Berkiella aquae]
MFKKTFWNGLKIFVPVVLTVAIVFWAFSTLETFFGQLIQFIIPEQYYFKGLGIIVGVAVIFIIGLLLNAWVVRKLYSFAERLVQRIPLIKTVYNAIQDLMSYFDKNSQSTEQQAVMIETSLGKIMGLITCDTLANLPLYSSDQEVLVYIPLSYQIGGLSVVVPKSAIKPINWSANQAMSFILTAGMTGKK